MKNNPQYYVYSVPWLSHEHGVLFSGTYKECQEFNRYFSACVKPPSILPVDKYYYAVAQKYDV